MTRIPSCHAYAKRGRSMVTPDVTEVVLDRWMAAARRWAGAEMVLQELGRGNDIRWEEATARLAEVARLQAIARRNPGASFSALRDQVSEDVWVWAMEEGLLPAGAYHYSQAL